jgi:hypothetical protein
MAAFLMLAITTQAGADKLGEAVQLSRLLDELVQPRFQKNSGVFGTDRVIRLHGHRDVVPIADLDQAEKRQLAKAHALNHDYVIGLLSVQHSPGSYKGAAHRVPAKARPISRPPLTLLTTRAANQGTAGTYGETLHGRLWIAALSALPQLRKGDEATTSAGVWSVTLRPVKATQQSCIGCHRGAKKGDTLGVLMYAVN